MVVSVVGGGLVVVSGLLIEIEIPGNRNFSSNFLLLVGSLSTSENDIPGALAILKYVYTIIRL